MQQIGTGLQYIHSRGVIHRDIKADNLLLTSADDDECHLKISDFGTARAIERDLTYTATGTQAYMAPEVEDGHYTYKVDFWSAGVVLYYMLTGSELLLRKQYKDAITFLESRPDSLLEYVKGHLLRGIGVDGACFEVLKRFLVCDPDKRVDWEEIICLEWLTAGKEERSLEIDGVVFKYWTKPVLGSGYSSEVYKGVMASTPEVPVAVKVVKEKYVQDHSTLLNHEIEILECLKAQNRDEFVRYFGHLTSGSDYIVSEYCNCTLASQIIGGVSETIAHSYMKQIGLFSFFQSHSTFSPFSYHSCCLCFVLCCIVAAIKVLYELGYIHRDIKPANILVKRDSDGSMRLVLTDFGFTTKRDDLDHYKCGTPRFLAPEVEQSGKPRDLMDIWSLGVTLYNMLVGSVGRVPDEVESGVLFLTLPDKTRGEVTDSCWQFVRRMLTVDPTYRMKYQELFSDPWLNATGEELDDAYFADRKACCDCLYAKFPFCSQKCVPRDDLERLLVQDTKTRRAHGFRRSTTPVPGNQAKGSIIADVTDDQATNTFQMFLDAALVFARNGAACEMISAPTALSNYHIAVAYLSLIPSSFVSGSDALLPPISARMKKLETDLFRIGIGEASSPV